MWRVVVMTTGLTRFFVEMQDEGFSFKQCPNFDVRTLKKESGTHFCLKLNSVAGVFLMSAELMVLKLYSVCHNFAYLHIQQSEYYNLYSLE